MNLIICALFSIHTISVGMLRDDVVELMGRPDHINMPIIFAPGGALPAQYVWWKDGHAYLTVEARDQVHVSKIIVGVGKKDAWGFVPQTEVTKWCIPYF
jgi:hypothetical protein